MDSSAAPVDTTSGRSNVPLRRLPPVPSSPSLRGMFSVSTAPSSPQNSVFSLSSTSSSGSSSPATSQGLLSPGYSLQSSPSALKQTSRPLPQIPDSCSRKSPSDPVAQLIVCRSCLNCITTSESLLAPSAVPPGSRAFRGFSGKASLFTEVYSVHSLPARVQLMVTGAHTMQEIVCAKCSAYLGWKIVKAHERTEKWKEGKWLMELENLWLAKSSDILNLDFEDAVEHGRLEQRESGRGISRGPRPRALTFQATSKEYPKDAAKLARTAVEEGLGLDFAESVNRYTQSRQHCYNPSSPNFTRSAIHLPLTVTT